MGLQYSDAIQDKFFSTTLNREIIGHGGKRNNFWCHIILKYFPANSRDDLVLFIVFPNNILVLLP